MLNKSSKLCETYAFKNTYSVLLHGNAVWFLESYLISLSSFFLLENGDKYSSCLTGIWGLNKSTYIKCLGQNLAYSKHSIALLILLIITNIINKSYWNYCY